MNMVLPEIFLIASMCFILLLDVFINPTGIAVKSRATYIFSLLALLITSYLLIDTFPMVTSVFAKAFIIDPFASFSKMLILMFTAIFFVYSRDYLGSHKIFKGETFVLCILSVIGMMVLISAKNFVSLYLGLELVALPIYALVAIANKYDNAPEAAMKYFVLGALSSGLLLYGISLLYGATGSLDLIEISRHSSLVRPVLSMQLGMAFVLAGVAFKFGAVPFHMWLPDVYEGSPTAITAFIGTVPKIAAFGMSYRLLHDAFPLMRNDWQVIILAMAMLSIGIGNIAALVQTNLKRMLAYSTISHVGFIFLGFVASVEVGFASAMFYMVIYVLTALAIFGVVVALSKAGCEAQDIKDYKGLSKRHPWLAFLMLILMFSMIGIPPLAGFYAKLLILQGLVKSGYLYIAIIVILFSVIGAYYYLRIIKVMYFDKPEPLVKASTTNTSIASEVILTVNSLSVLAFGILPGPLMYACSWIFSV